MTEMAVTLENTAVVISPLIPWSIAGAVSIAAVSASTASLFAAFYLYFLLLWNLFVKRRLQKLSYSISRNL